MECLFFSSCLPCRFSENTPKYCLPAYRGWSARRSEGQRGQQLVGGLEVGRSINHNDSHILRRSKKTTGKSLTRVTYFFLQAIKLAKYITQLQGQSEDDFSSQIQRWIDAGDLDLVMESIVANASLVGKASDKEYEGIVNLMIGFAASIKDEVKRRGSMQTLGEALKLSGRGALRQRLLTNLYGVADDKYSILLHIISQADGLDMGDLDQKLQEWNCTVDDKRTIYKQLSEKETNELKSYYYLQKYLRTFEKGAEKEAKLAIVKAINCPNVLNFEELWQLEPIQQLKGEAEYEWLKVFFSGNLSDFHKLTGGEKLGITDGLSKMRLVALVDLALKRVNGQLDYKEIAKELEINESEVEMWVIDGMLSLIFNS